MERAVGKDAKIAGTKATTTLSIRVPAQRIKRSILVIYGEKVLVDRDLADLYQVDSRILIQAVTRTCRRFPAAFMLQHSASEFEQSRSHFVISMPAAKMGLRRGPYGFIERGVAKLSSTVHSERAVEVNIEIMIP